MKSHYCLDRYKFVTEVVPGRSLVQVNVTTPGWKTLNYSTASWSTINELLPKHVIESIENMICLDSKLFIKKGA